MRAKAVLFDKDGTLFDFQKSWSRWIQQEIDRLAKGDPELAHEIADAIGFDLSGGLIMPGSPAIAGTSRDVAVLMQPYLPETTLDDLVVHLDRTAATLVPVEVMPLVPFLAQLAAMDLFLGVATNDSEAAARSHLRHFGIEGMFDYIAGYDSGHGAKPDPGMC
ncbi:MAG: HAD family hydrolase, partial [Paracoccaceae bacterium]